MNPFEFLDESHLSNVMPFMATKPPLTTTVYITNATTTEIKVKIS